MNVKVLCVPTDLGACGNWRALWPMSLLNRDNFDLMFRLPHELSLADIEWSDVVMLQRVDNPFYITICAQIKSMGKKLVVDIDDKFPVDSDHAEYPKYSPQSPVVANINACLNMADVVTVTTGELADFYSPQNPNIVVVPNGVDVHCGFFSNPLPKTPGKVTMVWYGGHSHYASLMSVKPAIEHCLDKFDNLEFAFCGPYHFFQPFNARPDQKRYFHERAFHEFLQVPSVADFAISPLTPGHFNDCKSEIRLLQGAAWSIPTIASDNLPHRRFVENSGGAAIIAKTHEQWIEAIGKLYGDRQARVDMGDRAHQSLGQHYDLNKINAIRESMLMKLAGR